MNAVRGIDVRPGRLALRRGPAGEQNGRQEPRPCIPLAAEQVDDRRNDSGADQQSSRRRFGLLSLGELQFISPRLDAVAHLGYPLADVGHASLDVVYVHASHSVHSEVLASY